MALIKNHKFVDDKWVYYQPDLEPNDQTTGVIFTLQTFTACSHNIPKTLKLGIKLANHDPVMAISEYIKNLGLVILEFPVFSDGRAYSQAQTLSKQLEFNGEIRATGNVLIDQYAFMLQCGFNAFEVPNSTDVDLWQTTAGLITKTYSQTQTNHNSHIWKLRKSLTE